MTPTNASLECTPGVNGRRALLRQNLERVRARIAAAGARSGRNPLDVRLVAVTKYVDEGVIRDLLAVGAVDLGENRVQQLAQRVEQLGGQAVRLDEPPKPGEPRWHMIGHLQRNKVKALLKHCSIVHSLDSVRLAEELHARASELGRTIDVLLEINVAGEAAKTGAGHAEAEALAAATSAMPALRVRGLMTMAPLDEDAEAARPHFRALRELRERLCANGAMPPDARELSMGMSHDFEQAVEEGATIVRVGSALFEGLAAP